jgi:type II secretory ATPase GspE/PulE/Tfp pilus assembly ATPase PilB-like protein
VHLNKNYDNNVITVEDPVEYQLPGVNQMPVKEETGFTFAEGLKSILRLSPDIVLVGEIRDRETALIAVESGLTGHMVLSTIHAPDVIGVIFRLLDLGIETYLLNASLRGVVAQRLVRKNCLHCIEIYQPTPDEVGLFTKVVGRPPTQLKRSKGCPACQGLGYSGRLGIYEVLKLGSNIRNLIRERRSEDELRAALINQQFITLFIDGLLKCEQGLTTISEVMRNSLRTD